MNLPYSARSLWRATAVIVVATLSGCAMLGGGSSTVAAEAVSLRNLQIESVDGRRAVLLRLSQLPQRVVHASSSTPARITVQISGPVGEGDFEEQVLPQTDPQIVQVRVAREDGQLEVTLDLKSDVPPPYSVHEMADWIMIRLGSTGAES